jgi:hypothetical protein
MPKIITTVEFSWAEIRQCLEEKTGLTLTDAEFDIEERGDYDKGTYEQTVKSVIFKTHIDEKAIINSGISGLAG